MASSTTDNKTDNKTNSKTNSKTRKAAQLAPLALLTAALTGCQPGDYQATFKQSAVSPVIELNTAGLADAQALAIDIQNEAGSVFIEAEPWRTEPEITSRVRWAKGDHGFDKETLPGSATASTDFSGGPAVLRVVGSLADGAPEDTRVDLIVRVPSYEGVNVSNAAGPVIIKGVGGAITVQNGLNGRGGGRIEVRTNQPVVDPVALITTEGRVSMVIPPESRATVNLTSDDAEAIFSSRYGSTAAVRSGKSFWTGVFNDGANPLTAQSGAGKVRVLVHDDPENYSVADGFASTFID